MDLVRGATTTCGLLTEGQQWKFINSMRLLKTEGQVDKRRMGFTYEQQEGVTSSFSRYLSLICFLDLRIRRSGALSSREHLSLNVM